MKEECARVPKSRNHKEGRECTDPKTMKVPPGKPGFPKRPNDKYSALC